jgi:hypothetical protein
MRGFIVAAIKRTVVDLLGIHRNSVVRFFTNYWISMKWSYSGSN